MGNTQPTPGAADEGALSPGGTAQGLGDFERADGGGELAPSPVVGARRSLPKTILDRTRNASSPPPFGSPLDSPSSFGVRRVAPTSPQGEDDIAPLPAEPVVPTVFRWTQPGQHVYVTGSFNNWATRIPLSRSRDEFTTIVDLPPGTHQYKFVVDDDWKCSPDQPTARDPLGILNNVIEVAASETLDADTDPTISAPSGSPPGDYVQTIPSIPLGTKAPPALPPHLLQVILNGEPVEGSEVDPTLLPVPNHVMLGHLYALSIRDGVMVLGVTHRYRNKYVTTVCYKPVAEQ